MSSPLPIQSFGGTQTIQGGQGVLTTDKSSPSIALGATDGAVTFDSATPEASNPRRALEKAMEQVNSVILGKANEVRLVFAALLAGGHALLDDLPGTGKTTLSRTLAATMNLSFQRVQFTSDLLPSDILGVSVFNRESNGFQFHPGPVFTNLLLADEINRASPRTQSALLEAMAEQQVTLDGVTRELPHPFFVLATQNPVDLSGTFPLPDSQLDRFLVRVHMGYPDAVSEKALLRESKRAERVAHLPVQMHARDVLAVRSQVEDITVSEAIIDYLHALIHTSRTHAGIRIGLSPRAGLAIKQLGQAWAFLEQRDYVLPSDIQAVFLACASHRLVPVQSTDNRLSLAQQVLHATPVKG